MVRPASWPDATDSDILAIFKRAVIVLNTSNWIYLRLATEKEVPVLRIKLETYYFVKPECKARLSKWKKGQRNLPAEHAGANK